MRVVLCGKKLSFVQNMHDKGSKVKNSQCKTEYIFDIMVIENSFVYTGFIL